MGIVALSRIRKNRNLNYRLVFTFLIDLKLCTFSDDPERPEVQAGTLQEGILVLKQEKNLLRSKIILSNFTTV